MTKTAYARHQDKLRKEAREKAQPPSVRNRRAGNICGAKKKGGGICGRPKGWGTTHTGIGRCRTHGGNTPAGNKNAAKQHAVLLGAPKEINPLEAIIWCIKLTGGEIEFYTEQMELLDKSKWTEDTVMGRQMHVFARERANAQDRLVNYSKVAISLGLTERAVKLAESYGSTIARLLRGIFAELEPFISDEGKQQLPVIVRRHMIIAEAGAESAKEFAAKQARAEITS